MIESHKKTKSIIKPWRLSGKGDKVIQINHWLNLITFVKVNNTIQTNLNNDSDVKCAQSITFKMEMPYSILLCNQNQNIASRTQTIHDLQS